MLLGSLLANNKLGENAISIQKINTSSYRFFLLKIEYV
jgi:hypothetical protein